MIDGSPGCRARSTWRGAVRLVQLVGYSKLRRDVSEPAVESLRRPTEYIKSLFGGEPLALHENALGLTDEVSGLDRSSHALEGSGDAQHGGKLRTDEHRRVDV